MLRKDKDERRMSESENEVERHSVRTATSEVDSAWCYTLAAVVTSPTNLNLQIDMKLRS